VIYHDFFYFWLKIIEYNFLKIKILNLILVLHSKIKSFLIKNFDIITTSLNKEELRGLSPLNSIVAIIILTFNKKKSTLCPKTLNILIYKHKKVRS